MVRGSTRYTAQGTPLSGTGKSRPAYRQSRAPGLGQAEATRDPWNHSVTFNICQHG